VSGAAGRIRSAGSILGRGTCRRSTATWWRSTSSSTSFGAVVSGELGQHLQHLAQQQVHQRRAHDPAAWQTASG
jgi:hypothetical protein